MKTIIYIRLPEEETPTLKRAEAIQVGDNRYQILIPADYDPEDEIWQFPPGSLVRCEVRKNSGEEILLAVEKVS